MNFIANTSYSFDIDCGYEFLTNIFDMGIYGSIIEIVIISDDIFHKSIPFYHCFCIFDKTLEYRKLSLRKTDFF